MSLYQWFHLQHSAELSTLIEEKERVISLYHVAQDELIVCDVILCIQLLKSFLCVQRAGHSERESQCKVEQLQEAVSMTVSDDNIMCHFST
jgi:hypothetical protein